MRKSVADRILEPSEPGPIKRGIKELLDTLDQGERCTKFPVVVLGCVLEFRYPQNSGDVRGFEKGGLDFLYRMKGDRKGMPPPYINALSERALDDDDILNAFCLHYWSHDDEKIDETQALRMVSKNPVMCAQIVERVDNEIRNGAMVISFGGVIEQKKGSSPTRGKNSGSKPRSSTAKVTPTS